MAYGIHWQINFMALHTNDSYRVEILQNNYNDEIVHLRGASNPFETIEDNNEDAFTPIRKQTGSLRIADTGYDMDGNEFDYTDMLPANTFDIQVKLWQEGTTDTLRWIGYIRPDSLTSKMFEKVSIREFKLICPLGTLYEVPVSFSNSQNNFGTVLTIGQILYKALGSVQGVTWSWVYKQNNVYMRNDLLAKVSLLNFISHNQPTHSTPSSVDSFNATWEDESTSWGSVVEEICKFWGWTLYSRGLSPYIVARNQRNKFTKFAFGSLNITWNSELSDEADTEINFEDLSYASTNHTECRRLGYKNIIVQSNVNEKETVLDPDFEKAEMSYWPVANDPNQIIHISNEYLYVLRRMGPQSGQQNNSQQFFDNYQVYENRIIATSSLIANFVICRHDGWDNESFKTATAFNFKKGINCYMAIVPSSYDEPLTYFCKTLEDVCIPLNSVICINASAAISYNPDPDWPSAGENGTLLEDANTASPAEDAEHPQGGGHYWKPVMKDRKVWAALKIGDLWWDNTNKEWTVSFSKFQLTFHEDGSIVDPENTFQNAGFNVDGILFDNHNGSKGFCIYVNSSTNAGAGLCGRMKLHIYASVSTYEEHLMLLNNGILNELSVSIYNQDSKLKPKNKASHEFKDVASTKFRNNLNVSLKMASGDKNVYGLGQLFNSDLSLLTTLTFRNSGSTTSVMQPEQRLLERMKLFYQNVSEQNTIEVLDDADAELPSTIIVKADSVQYHTQNVTHNWREGTMKLTLINN